MTEDELKLLTSAYYRVEMAASQVKLLREAPYVLHPNLKTQLYLISEDLLFAEKYLQDFVFAKNE